MGNASDSLRCTGITRQGDDCGNRANRPGQRCYHHHGIKYVVVPEYSARDAARIDKLPAIKCGAPAKWCPDARFCRDKGECLWDAEGRRNADS